MARPHLPESLRPAQCLHMKRYFPMRYNILSVLSRQSCAGEVVVPRTGKVRYERLLFTMSRPLSLKSITQAFSVAELAVVDDQYLLPAIPTNPFSGRVSHDADPAWPRLMRLSSSRIFGSRQSVFSHALRFPVKVRASFQDLIVEPGAFSQIRPVRLSATQSPLTENRSSGQLTPDLNSPSCPVPGQRIGIPQAA